MAATIGLSHAEKSEASAFGLSKTTVYRALSILALFALWQIGGLVPISVAFPTFSATMVAFVEMIADGRMISAYADTLKPLVIGVGISAGFGVTLGSASPWASPWASTAVSNGSGNPSSSCSRRRP
jgi:NitT/TauT family transport system permease protein